METLKRDHPNLPDSLIKEFANNHSQTEYIPIKYRNPNSPSQYSFFQSRRIFDSDPIYGKIVGKKNLPDKNDALGKLYAEAITRRHEADEVRASNQLRRLSDKKFYNKVDGLSIYTTVARTSHADPSVMMRESANVAIAPKSTKKFYKQYRLRQTLRDKLSTSDARDHYADRMKLVGKGYGENAIYNKKQRRALQLKNNISVNKALQGIINASPEQQNNAVIEELLKERFGGSMPRFKIRKTNRRLSPERLKQIRNYLQHGDENGVISTTYTSVRR